MKANYNTAELSSMGNKLNHAQKRVLGKRVRKQIKSVGTLKDAVGVVEAYELVNAKPTIKVGDKVKLNYEHIVSHGDYDTYNPRYREFIERHKDIVYTAERVPNKPYRNIFQFVEDDSPVKWYFCGADLIKVTDAPVDKAEEEYDESFDEEDDELDNDLDDYDD